MSHVQFSNGCRQDLEAFGAIKGRRSFVVCGSQSVGAFPIDVKKSQVDALATAGHKWLCAGYGAGFVYMSRALLARRPPRSVGWMSVENPFDFDNREYKLLAGRRAAELGCPPFAAIFALGAALDYLLGIGIPLDRAARPGAERLPDRVARGRRLRRALARRARTAPARRWWRSPTHRPARGRCAARACS